MALCFRRVLKNYNLLSYSSTLNHHNIAVDHKNAALAMYPPKQAGEDFFIHGVPMRINKNGRSVIPHRQAGRNSEANPESQVVSLPSGSWDKLYVKSMLENQILYCAEECRAYKEEEAQKETNGSPLSRPDIGQLERIHNKLSTDLPMIFHRALDYTIYHKNLIFENNIRGRTTIGIAHYYKEITLLRIYMTLKYVAIKVDILKITSHIEDGTVRVRWRARCKKFMMHMWKNIVKPNASSGDSEGWVDGFSIFYVKGDGLIHKHVASKMMPDESGTTLSVKNPLAAKVALLVLVMGKDLINDYSGGLSDDFQ